MNGEQRPLYQLVRWFSPVEIRELLCETHDREILEVLRDEKPEAAFYESVETALERRGLDGDERFFRAVVERRPRHAAAIVAIAAAHHVVIELVQPGTVPETPNDRGVGLPAVEALTSRLLERERYRRDGEAVPVNLTYEIESWAEQLRPALHVSRGSKIAGVTVLKALKSGTFGTVWIGTDDAGAKRVVKILHADKLHDGILLYRFRMGIRALQTLGQRRDAPSSIVRLRGVAVSQLAFSMDYINNGDLTDIHLRGWDLEKKVSIFVEVCRAVQYAHSQEIVHRDIKPANIVMTKNDQPVLTDFDISSLKFATTLSIAPGGVGTAYFAAPEQLENADNADESADIYSLGKLLHYLLIERTPNYRSVPGRIAGLPAPLVDVVRKATDPEPLNRYASVAQLIDDVQGFEAPRARLIARLRAARRWIAANAIFLMLLALVFVGVLAYAFNRQADLERSREYAASLDELVERLRFLIVRQDALATDRQELDAQIDATKAERDRVSAARQGAAAGSPEWTKLTLRLATLEEGLKTLVERSTKLDEELRQVGVTLDAELSTLQEVRESVGQETAMGSVTNTGWLDPDVVQRSIRMESEDLAACVGDDSAGLRMVVRLTIDSQGRVTRVTPPTGRAGTPAEWCIVKVLKGVQFPKPLGGRFEVDYPVDIVPSRPP